MGWKDGRSVGDPIDDGAKLHLINRHVGMAFAGDVRAGERAVRLVRQYSRRRRYTKETSGDIGRLLQLAYQAERFAQLDDKRGKVGPLQILMGICTQEAAWGIRYHSSMNFMALFVSGVQTIGLDVAAGEVRRAVTEIEAKRFGEKRVGPQPEDWMLELVAGIDSAVQKHQGEFALIGGQAQTLVIKRNEHGEIEFGQKLFYRSREKVDEPADHAALEDLTRQIRESGQIVDVTASLEAMKPLNAPRPRRARWLSSRAPLPDPLWLRGT